MNSPLYFAEYETDKRIRERYFPDFNYRGVVVEVGGGTPDFLSMSKHFKDCGWRAIIVEPNPMFVEKHRMIGNEIYPYACSFEDRDAVSFTVVSVNVKAYGGLVTDHAFSSLEIKPNYAAILPEAAARNEILVDVRRLDSLMAESNVSRIDLLSIDVEGWELEVLRGLDTNQVDCHVILLENLHHDPCYEEYMNHIGFHLDMKVEYNYVFVKKTIL